MLPKPDKSKKSKNAEQLDLVETISTADKLKHKRRWLYIAVFFTIGLSLLFWFYRTIKTIVNTSSFSRPQLSLPLPSKDLSATLNSQITGILSAISPGWSVLIYTDQKIFNWTKNTVSLTEPEIGSIINKLSVKKDESKSNIASTLPEGISLQEEYSDTSAKTVYHLLVNIPGRQILFVIDSPKNFEQSYPVISKLVSTLYWTIVQY